MFAINRGVKLNNFETCLLSVVFTISKVHEFIIQPSYNSVTRDITCKYDRNICLLYAMLNYVKRLRAKYSGNASWPALYSLNW